MRRLPLLLVLLLPACGLLPGRTEDPAVEVARRAAIQIQAMRKDETYDALASELAERHRQQAERLPDSERNRKVEVLGAALVRKDGETAEVAVVVRVIPNRAGATPLESRAFFVVRNGKVIRIHPTMP